MGNRHRIHIANLHDIPKLEIDSFVILSILANNIGNPKRMGYHFRRVNTHTCDKSLGHRPLIFPFFGLIQILRNGMIRAGCVNVCHRKSVDRWKGDFGGLQSSCNFGRSLGLSLAAFGEWMNTETPYRSVRTLDDSQHKKLIFSVFCYTEHSGQ